MQILSQAQVRDVVACPSIMMDGYVASIITTLDREGFWDVYIMSYTKKYASSLFQDFRENLHFKPKFQGKKTYQMNLRNFWEALAIYCIDILLFKLIMLYLEVIKFLWIYTLGYECFMRHS